MACSCGRPTACVRKVTFTAWLNSTIQDSGLKVQDLETDLVDGLILLKLIEILSPGNKIRGRYYAAPKSPIQKIQNLTLVFRFLTEVEKLPLNGITAGDILERNMEKTLELLWLLILHYHVDSRSQQNSSEQVIIRKNVCKRNMLVWVNAILPGKQITNFTTDWSSGENLAALVNFCKPGLVGPQIHGLHAYQRIVAVIEIAYKELNVPQILTPDDLFVDQPDEVAIMTYLSYFCRRDSPGERALLLWIQQQIPSQNITNLTTDWVTGINLGALVNKLTQNGFSQYETFSASNSLNNTRASMKKAEELLKIPSGGMTAESFSSDGLTYFARLAYLIQFYAAQKGEPVVMKFDVSKVQVSTINRGEEKGKKVVWIDVDCSNAGTAEIRATASSEAGKVFATSVDSIEDGEEKYRIKFVVEEGTLVYTLSVTYGGQEVSGSPFHVNLSDPDANKVQPLGTEGVTEWAECKEVVLGFDARNAGFGKLTAKASGESAGSVPVQLVPKPQGGHEVVFIPPIPDIYLVDVMWGKFVAYAKGTNTGTIPIDFQQDSKMLAFAAPTPDVYTVDVTWGGKPVPGSPFTINLLPPAAPENVETGDPMFRDVGEDVDLPVDLTHAGPGTLTATCTGDKVGKVETTIIALSKRLQQVSFNATQVDIYHLSVFFNDVHIKGSPFVIDMTRKVSGDPVPQPTLTREIGFPWVIEIPPKYSAKRAKISVSITGDRTGPYGAIVKKNSKSIYEITLNPTVPDIYTIDVQVSDSPVPECCFVVNYVTRTVPGAERCQLLTDISELRKIVDTNTEIQLSVGTGRAGEGVFEVKAEGPDGKIYNVSMKLRDDEEGVYDVVYVPKVIGIHYLRMLWDGREIPWSPLPFKVTDFSRITNFGHGKTVTVNVTIAGSVKESEVKAQVLHFVSGNTIKYNGKYHKGKYTISFTPKLSGLYMITLFIKDKELPGSLVVIRSGDPPNAQRCSVQEIPATAHIGQDLLFKVDATKAGSGELNVKLTTHKLTIRTKSKVKWRETLDEPGVYLVTFTPGSLGQHSLHIFWAGKHVPNSPLSITVVEKPVDTRPVLEVYVSDPTISKNSNRINPIPEEIGDCVIGQTLLLQIKTNFKNEGLLSSIGRDIVKFFTEECKVTAKGEKSGETHNLQVKKSSNDNYYAEFVPTEKDRYSISILYDNEDVVNSPIVAVFDYPETDATKVSIPDLIGRDCFSGQVFKFEIKTTGAGVGPLKVTAQPPGEKKHVPVKVTEDGSNTFIISYIPQVIGTHLLHVLWGEKPILHSPLTIEVRGTSTVPPGQPGVLEFPTGKWKFSDIQSVGTHIDTGRNYPVKRKQKRSKYVFSIQPDEPGTYEIALRVEGKDICRPFWFKYEQPSRPEKVVVFDLKEAATVNEVVKFKVDVSEAGQGPLSIRRVSGPGKVNASLDTPKNGMHTVSFSANDPGEYLLTLTWGEMELPGCPFIIRVSNTWQKSIGDRNSPDHGPVSQFAQKENTNVVEDRQKIITRHRRWQINISEEEGKLEVTAVGEKTGPAEIYLTQVRNRVYQVTFRPTKSDKYTISTLLNGVHMSNSPQIIEYEMPPRNVKKVSIAGWSKVPSIITVGKTVQFTVDARDAGLGELKVNPKTPMSTTDTHILEVNESAESATYYTVSYTPLIAGMHSLELFFSDLLVPGSPLQVTVIDPCAVTYTLLNATKTLKIGQEITLEMDTSKAGSDDLTATVEGTSSGKVAVKTSSKQKGKFLLSFKPQKEDVYTLSVKLCGHDIKGSPFTFNLTPIKVEKISVTGPQMPEGPDGPIKLIINTSGVPKGKLESYCKFKQQTVSVQVKEESPNVFSLVFKPEEPAKYVWYILYEGQNIPGSPFTIDTRPRPDKAVVVVPEHGSVRIGQYVTYEVDMSGAGIGTLTATCRMVDGQIKVPVQTSQIRWGVYRVSFLPLSFGTYTLYIQWSGKEINNSPFTYVLDPHKVEKLDIPFILPVIEDSSALRVTCKGKKYGVVAVNLVRLSANNYSISFKSKGADLYTVNVLYNGVHVKDSPMVVDLRQAVSKGSGPLQITNKEYKIVVGTAVRVKVERKGGPKGGSDLRATAVGKITGNCEVEVEQYSTTFYQVNFNPKRADTYTLSILLDGSHIPQSPFLLHYTDPPVDPTKVVISGLDDILSVLDINKEVSFVVNAMKGGSGTLHAEIRGPTATNVDIHARDGQPGTYLVSFNPTVAGLYILSLFWNGVHIPNSPLKIRIIDTSQAEKTFTDRNFITKEISLKFGPTEIQAYAVKRDSTQKLNVTIEQIKTHLYRFIFSHNQPGYYFIHILVNGEEVDLSPIPVYISDQSWANKIRVINFPNVGYKNHEFSMTIDYREGGDGKLEARVIEPNKSERHIDVLDHGDGTVTMTYVPTAEGTYTFYVTWGGQNINGSPFQLVVTKQSEKELPIEESVTVNLKGESDPLPPGTNQMTTNSYFAFSIRLTADQKRKFIARAISVDGTEYDFKVESNVGDLFKYAFHPPMPGNYTFKFSLGTHKIKIPQLPEGLFVAEPEVDPTKIVILRESIPGLLLIDQQIFFQIDTRLGGKAKLTANLEGPFVDEADFRFVPTPGMPEFYDVSFTPVVAGTYNLHLLWDEKVVPDCPLVLNVTDLKIRNSEPGIFVIPIDSHAKDITSYATFVETGERVAVEVNQISKRRYKFEFTPQKSGKYDLHVLVDDKDIRGSPFRFIYGETPKPLNVTASFSTRVEVNNEVQMAINAQKGGDGHLNIEIEGPETVEYQLTEVVDALYKVKFTPTHVGKYNVRILWSDEDIPNSPFEIEVEKGGVVVVEPQYTPHDVKPIIIKQDRVIFGTTSHTIGENISFRIGHHGYSERLDIRFTPDLIFKVTKDDRVNKYEIFPKFAGKYDMVILWDGKVLSEVYTLFIEQPKVIGGFSLQHQSFKVGRSYQFVISSDNVSPGGMEITCKPRDAADIVCSAITSTQFSCSLVPKTVGDATIIVSYNGYEIQGSPFEVNFVDASAFSCKFGLQSEGIEIRDIMAELESSATQQAIPISLQQLFGGECNLDFVPSDGDEYKLTITCDLKIKKEIMAGSPFKLAYVAAVDGGGASKCNIDGAISGGFLGQWSNFSVDCTGAGSGSLTAEIVGGGGEVKVVSLSEYKYEVHYRIIAGGNYQLRVMWDGKEIQGSPFNIKVESSVSETSSSSSLSLSMPNLVEASENIEIDCEIDVPNSKDLSFEAITESGRKHKGTLTQTKKGYHVSIPTSERGEYSVYIYYQGNPILPKPYKVKVGIDVPMHIEDAPSTILNPQQLLNSSNGAFFRGGR